MRCIRFMRFKFVTLLSGCLLELSSEVVTKSICFLDRCSNFLTNLSELFAFVTFMMRVVALGAHSVLLFLSFWLTWAYSLNSFGYIQIVTSSNCLTNKAASLFRLESVRWRHSSMKSAFDWGLYLNVRATLFRVSQCATKYVNEGGGTQVCITC